MTEETKLIVPLAYTTAQAAQVTGRSHTRIKKGVREKELTARKDGRATLIEHAELQRWLASLRTIGREPVQEPARVAARGSAPISGLAK
jgi:excisionase family DNA binding protein